MRILIVGGGLAGLTAGSILSKEGNDVVIVEKTRFLGGSLQTLPFEDEHKNQYLFDMGPHVTAKWDKNWNSLSLGVEQKEVLRKESIEFEGVTFSWPLKLECLFSLKLLKCFPSYAFSMLFKKEGVNLENSMINQFGIYSYKKYMKKYMAKFWKKSQG